MDRDDAMTTLNRVHSRPRAQCQALYNATTRASDEWWRHVAAMLQSKLRWRRLNKRRKRNAACQKLRYALVTWPLWQVSQGAASRRVCRDCRVARQNTPIVR